MACDVLSRKSFHVHQLHYGLGDGIFYAQMRDCFDEALVELGSPNEALALERAGRLLARADGGATEVRRRVEVWRRRRTRFVAEVVGGERIRVLGGGGDVECEGEVRGN